MEFVKKAETRRSASGRKTLYGIFKCECGKEEEKSMSNGKRQVHCMECGNASIGRKNKIHRTTHGDRYTRLYNIWQGMNSRCHKEYKASDITNYKNRGITVCEEWRKYEPFKKWAEANGYSDNLTIDRKDNDGNYEPANCRWVTMKEQAHNTQKTKCTQKLANEIRDYKMKNGIAKTDKKYQDVLSRSIIHNVVYGGQW